ncbi:MAG: hypothetical protein R3C25_06770 [Hyphomonadaceae bacterium]
MPSRNVQALDPASLAWPDEADAASDSLEANHYYMADVRLARWEDVDRVLRRESEVLPLLSAADHAEAEWESQSERISAAADGVADEFFCALDPGVASTVLALGAAGCIPFWSCNGGAFGGDHSSPVPTVKFFAKAEYVTVLAAAAQKSGAKLHQDEHGRCAVSAEGVDVMQAFALALHEMCIRG